MNVSDALANIGRSFLDGQAMLRTLPDMLAYGVWNTLLLAVCATAVPAAVVANAKTAMDAPG